MGCADALIFLETEEADILAVGFFFFAVESGQTFALGCQARLEAAAGSTLTLPIYPELPDRVPAQVAEVVRQTLAD